MKERMRFRIPIGDWSGDGHDKCEWFTASAEKDINCVRDAYFNARESLPSKLHPENICNNYEDDSIDIGLREEILSLSGITLGEESGDYVQPEDFAAYVIWFIDQGDADLNVMLEPSGDDMLHFSGLDDKKRHIYSLGYGLFL